MPVHPSSDRTEFARAELSTATLADMLPPGDPTAIVDEVQSLPIRYAWGSPATAGLWRVDVSGHRGETTISASYFVKLLRNLRLWPQLNTLPEPSRTVFAARRNWRIELDMYESGIGAVLPPGMRTPVLHQVRRDNDDYVALWWEFVDVDPRPWTVADFARTAFLLGRLAARRAVGRPVNDLLPDVCHQPWPATGLRTFVQYRVLAIDLPRLRDPAAWAAPEIATALDALDERALPVDLSRLADRIPTLLDRLDTLPQTYAHGDASPQNLLIPRDDPSTRVVIDWGLEKPVPVGFDLGQLLIGLAHADELPVDELSAVEQCILPSYRQGLSDEGWQLDHQVVREGFIASLICRSALSAIPFPAPGLPPVSQQTLHNRIRLSRHLLDLAATLP